MRGLTCSPSPRGPRAPLGVFGSQEAGCAGVCVGRCEDFSFSFLNETWKARQDPKEGEKKNLTPNWKRPLTCAIFLPGSSAKNKTVQTLGRGGRALEFSVCRNDPKEKGRHSPRSPGRPKEPAAPPLPWAGEIPRPARPAPLLRGRATPQLCARKQPAARAPAPPPGPPPPPPAPLLESEGGAPLGQPATPGKGLASPAELDQPRSRGNRRSEPPPALAAASLARSRGHGPRPCNFVPGEISPSRLPGRPCPCLGSHRGPGSQNVAPRVT